MSMTWKQRVARALRTLGYDLTRYRPANHPEARRLRLMESYGVDLVLDVGANTGQYGAKLREAGFTGRIVSFEPLSSAFRGLQEAADADPEWQVHPWALGSEEGHQTIHVAGNSTSSSLLEMLPTHLEAAPYSAYTGEETIQVETLDQQFADLRQGAKSVWLKIDTQGYEKHVLDGAKECLPLIGTVQMEISLAPLYDGSTGLREMLERMEGCGYGVVGIDPGFCDSNSGRLLQADLTFHREK